MSKVNVSVKGGQLSELEKLATAQLPTGTPVEPAPESSPAPSGSALDQLMAGPEAQPVPEGAGPETTADVLAGVDAMVQQDLSQEIHDVPNIAQRRAASEIPNVAEEKWLRTVETDKVPMSKQSDGGIEGRANGMVQSVKTGQLTPSAGAGEFGAAIEKAGAAERRSFGVTPNDTYVKVGSYVTENMIADLSFGISEGAVEVDPLAEALGETPPAALPQEGPKDPAIIKNIQGSEKLGQQIHQEYKRLTGDKRPDKLPPKEAAVVGQIFKDMWVKNNPNYAKEFKQDGVSVIQLTSEGQKALEEGQYQRARLFPSKNVRPQKTPIAAQDIAQTGLQGTRAKDVSGKVGKAQFGGVIEGARENLAQVPNVVDKQRAKILLSTILPVLQSGDHSTWMAEINNFGPSKQRAYAAERANWERRQRENPSTLEDEYDPRKVMRDLTDKIAQEVQAIAQERNGANYLTYNIQAFNGRLTPQQTVFNPTTSKAVRFVTRNATPSIVKPGTRVERNLRQMYAMMLVGDVTPSYDAYTKADKEKGIPKLKADALLPQTRDAALTKASPRLEAWGNRLAQALTMTDAQYEQISQAIAEGKPLNDPAYGEIPQLALDLEQDADLISFIEGKGEDGPHAIDGLIDFANYMKAKRNGQPYPTYFNAYIDGKTNGIASNGIQMGSIETAAATGVFRDNRKQLLDKGDIRDQIADIATASIDNGWDGNVDAYITELNTVAKEIYNNRDLNKHTTMTFGYGKEVESFKKSIEDTIGLIMEDPQKGDFIAAMNSMEGEHKVARSDIAGMLLDKYSGALGQALSDEAMDSRALMRGAAALHAATNSLFSIKTYTGMDLNLGDTITDMVADEQSEYYLYGDNKRVKHGTVYHYGSEATSSAARTRTDAEGNVTSTPGDRTYGGSLPGPVQSLDAATVAMSAYGKSWDRLKMNSGGNPYMHTIYDAFKTDANGFDVIVEEVNKNWMKAASEWSYLQETFNSTKKVMDEFHAKMRNRNPNEALTDNERLYMDWFLKKEPAQSGNMIPKNLIGKMTKFKEYKSDKELWDMVDKFNKSMRSVGYNMDLPPEKPTVAQLKMFVSLLQNEMNLGRRMQSMIDRTNKNKKALIQKLKESGYKTPSGERIALQYYAH